MGCPTQAGPSTITVDLNANAVDIACRLGSLVYFLEAAEELQTCNNLVSTAFKRYSRKIISLVEVARRTLTAAGISVYMFCTCSPTLAPFRTAYINLLRILKERRCDVDAALQGRVSRLLQPLSSGFVIQRWGDPTVTLAPTFQMAMKNGHDRKQSNDSAFWPVTVAPASAESYSSLMPPPDAFPAAMMPRKTKKVSSHKRQRRLWDPEIIASPSPRKRYRSPDIEQENEVPPPRVVPPIPRRFGIFCTGKSSMLSSERMGRSRTPRALAKD